jgi:hypothetical protein
MLLNDRGRPVADLQAAPMQNRVDPLLFCSSLNRTSRQFEERGRTNLLFLRLSRGFQDWFQTKETGGLGGCVVTGGLRTVGTCG